MIQFTTSYIWIIQALDIELQLNFSRRPHPTQFTLNKLKHIRLLKGKQGQWTMMDAHRHFFAITDVHNYRQELLEVIMLKYLLQLKHNTKWNTQSIISSYISYFCLCSIKVVLFKFRLLYFGGTCFTHEYHTSPGPISWQKVRSSAYLVLQQAPKWRTRYISWFN